MHSSRYLKLFAVCTLLYSCSKNTNDLTPPPAAGLPTITTSAIISIGSTTAVSGGTVTSDGGAAVTARGVVWDINSSPTLATASKPLMALEREVLPVM
ncbi:MAG: hypothetical protein IPP96_12410 [Chitinophagaceae bacterium]|nr:hypothetical protein [Chitinophagaceae bacterium]